MFKPHVTVACVVQAEDQFLIVEETIHGQPRWNQPAGHLEADETVIVAAQRELWEEAGIKAAPSPCCESTSGSPQTTRRFYAFCSPSTCRAVRRPFPRMTISTSVYGCRRKKF